MYIVPISFSCCDVSFNLDFRYPDNWRLQIIYATLRDSGLYKCQVEIDPTHSLVKHYNVIITGKNCLNIEHKKNVDM